MPAAQVLMTTTVGPITLELDADSAPKTVENFLSYVSNGFYDGTIFHRRSHLRRKTGSFLRF